jgi:hypothetical protein
VGTTILTFWAAGTENFAAREMTAAFIVNLMTYGALSYGYFHFLNLGETARRVRILREIVEANRPLSLAEILERYDAREVVRNRLERLTGKGQVLFRDGRYTVARETVLRMAQAVDWLKRLLLGRVEQPAGCSTSSTRSSR